MDAKRSSRAALGWCRHGISATLTELQLTGSRLALSLLGFNVGIGLMQPVVVALVLPPVIPLARTRLYAPLRWLISALTAAAAPGWLAARIGQPNMVADPPTGSWTGRRMS